MNYPISIKFDMWMRISITRKSRNFANSRWRTDAILKIVFAYISAPYWPSNAKFETETRITCRYRSRDHNGNFRKFRMTDGRHFKNSFISISQPSIIRFRSNLVYECELPFRGWIFDRRSKFRKFKMADGRHIENRFWLYLGAILTDVWKLDSCWCRIACKQRLRDQNSNFQQFNMAAATMLKVVFRRLGIPVTLVMN